MGISCCVGTLGYPVFSGLSSLGIVAIAPEGNVRHWSMPDRQFCDSAIDLDREVALSLTRINLQSSGFVI